MTTEDTVRPPERCPRCGVVDPQPRRFCAECGFELRQARPQSAERRSLTVMFCDIVGSTALSERLDPEELSDLILVYRDIVAAATARYGGFVARYVGDGVLAYFGYPKAHGDDPLRALHAALEVVARMRTANRELRSKGRMDLPVRIGVHTGLVLVGDFSRGAAREEAGALGETPNLAARIMDLAPVNSVLVSGVTQALTADHFDWRDMGETPIEGLSRPVRVFELLEVTRHPPDQFDSTVHVTRLANRARELAFLRERWERVLEGHGQIAVVVGEPGMGKTRLIRAFADGLAGTDHAKLVFQCSPYFSNSAFYPVVDFFKRWLDKSHVDPLQQLAEEIRSVGMSADEVVPVIASLLSLPIAPPYRAPPVSPRVQRDLTMTFLRDWLMRLASDSPTLIVIEDLHWADASTMELVGSVMESLAAAPILVIAAVRPPFHDAWQGRAPLATLTIERLTTAHVHELIGNVTGGSVLPEPILEEVALKTDGVPLFIEELTKAVMESNAPSSGLEIPISLHATLMARLDSMNAAKLVAQRASVLGREFSYELIVATTDLPAAELDRGLSQLVDTQLLFQSGVPPRSKYLFKHAMIQETAYRSLLRTQRREYHLAIAEALAARFPAMRDEQPELLAHHFSEARRPLEAAAYWRAAGDRALARSANVEAHAHLEKGLNEVSRCPASQVKLQEEVQLLVAFGSALSALKGSAAPEVEQTYARAHGLCRQLDDPRLLFPALRGLQSFYVVHGPLRTACGMVEQLCEMADDAGDSLQRVEANRRLGWCRFCMGELEAGRAALRAAMDIYDRSQSVRHILTVGSDPGVIGFVNLAWLEGFAGRPQQAVKYSEEAIRLASDISYDLGMAYALGMSAALYQCLGDAAMTASLAHRTVGLAESRGFPYWVAWETGLLGWATAVEGDVDIGILMLEKGFASYRETGSGLFCAHLLGLLADVNLRCRRYQRALELCEEALGFADKTDAHFFDAEIHRLEGECMLARDRDAPRAAESFTEAVRIARKQGAGMLELRAAIRLAEVERSRGRAPQAVHVLSESVAAFRGEDACAEYASARELLKALS
jgi:class 3 adenylate cyclase/tetratricopeptide (TPR) repeat protein